MSQIFSSKSSHDPRGLFPVTLSWDDKSLSVNVLIDSGADNCLIDREFAIRAGIPFIPLARAVNSVNLDGRSMGSITQTTASLTMLTSGNHVETIRFYVTYCAHEPVVLGRTWLERHDPHISWPRQSVLGWSVACHANCLRSALSQSSASKATPVVPDLTKVPSVYHNLALAFSKDRALSLPPHLPYDCPIDLLPGAPLPVGRLYNLSKPEKESMRNYISESLVSGIIKPSSSPVAAGFFFVGKKDGGLRPCIDYRQLNDITIKNKYPLPLINSTFEPLTEATIFSKLDLRNAYHLVRIRKGDEWKTAFNTHLGHFEYLVMPFGLTNAPAIFQALVNDVLRDMLNVFVVVYLDDILIFSPNETEHVQHVQHVRLVLRRLLENRLYIKAEKCEFHSPSVEFLGFVLEKGVIRANPKKVSTVIEWPQPADRKQLRRFLGFANYYRRFIRGYSRIAAPLSAMTSTLRNFSWSPEAESAFSTLKECFSSAPVLVLPDTSRQFILEVDASDSGIGAVLSQRSEEDQLLHPCAFFSRRFTSAERNYDVGNRELLAVHDALKEWRHWLEGAAQPFVVWSDHKDLVYIRTAKRLNPRQARWALFFDRFDFTLTFRPGSKNVRADALSRLYSESSDPSEKTETILPPSQVIGVVTWGLESMVRTAQRADHGPGGGPPNRLFVPRSVRSKVLEWGHSSRFSGHPGVHRSSDFIRRRFWWPTLTADVREFISACDVCARSKTSHRPPSGLLRPLPIPSRPWSHIALDFVTGLPKSQGNDTILTLVDRFSKAVHYVALPKLPNAAETADLLVTHVVRLHGIPLDVVSDRGPQFTSKVWRAFCKGLGASVSLSSGYHPQTNGQAERANQALEATLRCFTKGHPSTWSTYLPWVEYAHNTLVSSATGMSPFQCSLGYQPPLFSAQEPEVAVPSTRAHLRRCQRVWKTARSSLLRARDRAERTANRRRIPAPPYRPGQRVMLLAKNVPLPSTNRKLAPRYVGPYSILNVINPSSVRLDLPPS